MTDLHTLTEPDDDRIDPARFDRYVTGTATPEDAAAIRRWACTPARQRLLADAAGEFGKEGMDRRDRVWATIGARIGGFTPAQGGRSPGRTSIALGRQTLRLDRWLSGAALVLGALLIVIAWNIRTDHLGKRSSSSGSSGLLYTTGNGERATITLPDGGTVALNVASRLEVPADYTTGNHTVRLIGEGLFSIPHHGKTSFTVVTGSATTRVLGTSFVVRQYAPDTTTVVAVEEGRVSVGGTVVATNQLAEVGRRGTLRVRKTDASPFSFAAGVLTLSDMPLQHAIVELDRWYNVDIRLGNSVLATRPLHGEFVAGSISDLATMLEWAYQVRVVRTGRILTLYPRQ